MREIIRINKNKIIHALIYFICFIPNMFSIYYSVPASDDFAFGARTCSDNILLNALGYSIWNWNNWSGRWLTFFYQKLFNPLNLNIHLGHVYGAYMIVLFWIVFLLIHGGIKTIVNEIFDSTDSSPSKLKDTCIFTIIMVLYSTFYYAEVYNWYVGATAYALPMGLFLISIGNMIKFISTGNERNYRLMILTAIIPATNEFFDVPLGVIYIFIIFGIGKNRLSCSCYSLKKKLVPLMIYIICGISCVFAPGNFRRQSSYELIEKITAISAVKTIVIDEIERLKLILLSHRITVLLFLFLIIIGYVVNINKKQVVKFIDIIIVGVIGELSILGSMFPYVYGRAISNTYLDSRMQYLFDFIFECTICICCILFGEWVAYKKKLELNYSRKVIIAALGVVLVYNWGIASGQYKNVVQFDIINKKEIIVESYNYWNGIILEIENSTDANVVINRKTDCPWIPYFLWMGLANGDVYAVDFDTVYDPSYIMPNVYYDKESIQLNVEETVFN